MDWCWDLIRKCMWIFGNVLSGKRSAMRRKRSNVYTSVVYHETLIILEGPKRSSCIVLLCLVSLHMTFLLIAYIARPQWTFDVHSTLGLLLPLSACSLIPPYVIWLGSRCRYIHRCIVSENAPFHHQYHPSMSRYTQHAWPR